MEEKALEKLLKPKDIQEIMGCGKDRAYAIIKSKSFPKIKIGKLYYIPTDSFRKWYETYTYKEYKL